MEDENEVLSISDASGSSDSSSESSEGYSADQEELDQEEEEDRQNDFVAVENSRKPIDPPRPTAEDRKLKNVDALVRYRWFLYSILFLLKNLDFKFQFSTAEASPRVCLCMDFAFLLGC